MFRWCSYCQHLIGEVPPLPDFRVTHGICEACAQQIETYTLSADVLHAKTMFESLEAAGRGGDFNVSLEAIDKALEAGLSASEVVVGVLHPALARIGQLWESGEITVAEEHRFTDFALRVIDRLRFPQPLEDRPLVLLAIYPENRHEVGPRMLQILAWERGIPCERLPVGTSAEAIAETIAALRPDLVGLSVSLIESIPAALALAQDLSQLLKAEARLALGGQAFRRDDSPEVFPGHKVLLTIDAYVACLQELDQECAQRARAVGPKPGNHSS